MTIELTGKNIIGGELIEGTGSVIQGINPNTNETLAPEYKGVSDADFDQAMELAWNAFLEYRLVDDKKKAVFLETIASEIESVKDDIVARAMLETGLPQARLEGETGRTCGQLRLFATVLRDGKYQDIRHDEALPDRTPLPRPELYFRKIGLGPVAVFGASNFPLAFSVAGGDTASALAAGCPVVVKAHQAHPGTSELVGQAVARAVARCNMPKGVFALIYGSGSTIGQKLVSHPYIKAVGFTGSRAGGTALMNTAASRPEPIPVYAEMSSINPVYILPEALKSRGAAIGEALVQSMMMGAGQFCTSPGLVFIVDGDGADAFIAKAKETLSQQTSQTMLTPGIAEAFNRGVAGIESVIKTELLATAQVQDKPNQCVGKLFLVNGDDYLSHAVLHEEVFGSSSIIVRCKDVKQVQAITEQLEGQLTASVHSDENDSVESLQSLLQQLERKVGRILFNGFGTGVEVANAMVHGGPFPSTSDGRSTSVGTAAIERFLRAVCYQNVPSNVLPKVFKA
ncbi:aldehyde dehydrogenase (NADP(+)) [Pelistega suis]|uniref:aldehyde dehydrogenase (NADP(+)) n=1 Tax=Pelistega suis TaxID=1631957 RepID=UPI00211CC7C4|nr:aldehyde dehydrogenase (NADP(+)) [Pelistega suis]MCQ9329591.1 aldehyde dehydrogenase (NADP(+)) [Pelistega suis]